MVALLAGAALAVRAPHLDWGLPEVFEEATPVRKAVEFWGEPGTPAGVDLNPRFFKYPSLTFYLHFLVQAGRYLGLSASGQVDSLNDFRQLMSKDFGRVVLHARWVQAILGALLVIPTFVLGRRLGGPATGWVAAAVIAVLPTAVAESRVVGPDMALAVFAAAGLASATRVAGRGRRDDYLWCGLWIGLAASAKYPGALLVAALFTAHVQRVLERREGPAAILLHNHLAQAAFVAAVAFVATSPYVLLDVKAFLADVEFERRHMQIGHLGREEGRAWSFYLTRALPRGWTWWVMGLAAAGAVLAAIAAGSRRRLLPGLAFALVTLVVLGSWRMAAARYLLPLAPLGAAWAAWGVTAAARRAPGRGGFAAGLVVLGAAAIGGPAVATWSERDPGGRVDSRTAAAAWIRDNVPEGKTLLVERYGPDLSDDYNVLHLPFHGVTPHVYDPAYAVPLYATFDYVVLSSGVHARYFARPRDYPMQMAFYRDLDARFVPVRTFESGRHPGPTIRILEARPGGAGRTVEDIPREFFEHLEGNSLMAEYLSQLGAVLAGQGNPELAFRVLEEAVQIDPENARVRQNLGAVEIREGRFEDALFSLRRARELDPQNADAIYNLATLFRIQGELRQATEAYNDVIALEPAREGAYIGLARVLVEDGRYGLARAVLNEFLGRFPRSSNRPAAEAALHELAQMGPGRP